MSDGLRCPFGHEITLIRPISKEAYCQECGMRWETVACTPAKGDTE